MSALHAQIYIFTGGVPSTNVIAHRLLLVRIQVKLSEQIYFASLLGSLHQFRDCGIT